SAYVDSSQASLYICLISIAASPLAWNVIGRNGAVAQYKHHTLMKLIGARVACTILGVVIFLAGLLRDVLCVFCMFIESWFVFDAGNFLVAISYYALAFYGTFVGDYFGILQEKRVTSFAFNILDNPMYFGATLCFVGGSAVRPAGLLVALYVHLTYAVALRFEG
ncbi:phospholipid methyltransferase-domain-containing protein, partial [Mycena rosella]